MADIVFIAIVAGVLRDLRRATCAASTASCAAPRRPRRSTEAETAARWSRNERRQRHRSGPRRAPRRVPDRWPCCSRRSSDVYRQLAPVRRADRGRWSSPPFRSAATWPGSTATTRRRPATGSSARSSGVIYRICRVDPKREQRWTVYAYSLLGFSVFSFLAVYAPAAAAGVAAAQPDRHAGGRAAPVVQHRGQLHDQHELAVLRRRGDDEPPHPDGRPGGAELRVRGRRHGDAGGADPRPGPPAGVDDRQLLGRPRPARPCASCCRWRSCSRSSSSARA